MKKFLLYTVASLLLLCVNPAQIFSANPIDPTTPTQTANSERSVVLTARIAEIKAIDKSGMNFSEKRQLRKEKRSIKHELKDIGNGVYISGAGIILLVILLIILL